MNRWIIGLLSGTLLMGNASGGTAAAASTPPTTQAALTAVTAPTMYLSQNPEKASNTLHITLENCSTLEIQEVVGGTLALNDPQERHRAKIGVPSGGATAVYVTGPKDTSMKSIAQTAALTIPQGTYATVVINAEDSGVNVRPIEANYRITADESAVALNISQGYGGKVDLQAEECAVSVNFTGQMQNTALTLKTKACSINLPKGWTLEKDRSLSLLRGTGAAKINISADECAMSVEEGTTVSDSQYSKLTYSVTGTIQETTGAVLQTGKQGAAITTDQMKTLEKASTPNIVAAIKHIPAAGITGLRINSELCGVAVEPSTSGEFEFSYIGVTDQKRYTVTTAVKHGVLTVTAKGTQNELHYIQTEPGKRVNTVLIGVPANVLSGMVLDCGSGSILVNGVDHPIRAIAPAGLIRIKGDTIRHPIEGAADRGCIMVEGKTLSGKVELSAENGNVSLKADSVSGDVDLSAENGSVNLDADRIRTADLSAENGAISAVVGVIGQEISAEAENGAIKFQFTQAPKNLTFHLEASKWSKASLPSGWYDGYTIGNGKPELDLEIGNGFYQVKVGK